MHKIFIGYTEDEVLDILAKTRTPLLGQVSGDQSIESLRRIVSETTRDYWQSYGAFLVNTNGWKPPYFGLFLKSLEYPSNRFTMLFFGSPIENYPETFKSRCTLEIKRFPEEEIDMKVKDTFLDFLRTLETAREEDFSIIYSFAKDMDEKFVMMFWQWMTNSEVFTPDELRLCFFLKRDIRWFTDIIMTNPKAFFMNLFIKKVLSESK